MSAFSDLKVLDISSGFAASFCSRLLADFGAEVFKVSLPDRKDVLLDYGPVIHVENHPVESGMYHFLNFNKSNLPESMKEDPAGFLSSIDIVVEDFSETEHHRVDVRTILSGVSEDAIVCSITPFGRGNDWSERPYSDLTIQAISGYCSVNGTNRGYPLKEPGMETEFTAGANAFSGIVAALIHRDTTGIGQRLDVSLLHSSLSSYSPYLLGSLHTGQPTQRREQGLHFGLFPCKDGYVSLSVRHEPTWELLWVFLGDPDFARDERFDTAAKRRKNEAELSRILLPQLARYTREELLTELSPLRIMVGPANSIDDLINDKHLGDRKALFSYSDDEKIKMPSNPSKMTSSPSSFRNSAPPKLERTDIFSSMLGALKINTLNEHKPVDNGPLDGLRATVLTQAWAGAYSTQLLGDLGMDVIQVESIHRLDPWRGGLPPRLNGMYADNDPGERPWNRNAQYNSVNRNKKGMTLDLNDEECKAALLDLIKISDVFVENFSGRVIGNLGLDYESLRKVNPSIVMLRMPTYGTYGPYSTFPGNGGTTEPVSGMSHLIGYPGGPPLNSGIMHTDAYCGILSAGAVLTALRHRVVTGKGQCVEVSQQEGTMSLLAEYLVDASHNGSMPGRQGNFQRNAGPQGCYKSRDNKWVALSVTDQNEWNSLCLVLGIEDLKSDSRFLTRELRQKNGVDLDNIISEVIKKIDAVTVAEKIRENGIPCEVVLDTLQVATKQEFYDMELYEEILHRDSGAYYYVSPPWNYSRTRVTVREPAPTLGEHTESILRDLVDRNESIIQKMKDLGHIGTDPVI